MPELSTYETSPRLSSIFFFPSSSRRRTASRSCTLPSPMVILPERSNIATSPTWRSLMFKLAISLSLLFCALALDLFHSHYASALGMNRMLDLIHECAHIKNSPATRVKQIIRIRGIRQLVRVEPFTLIPDVNRERAVSSNETNIHLLVDIAPVAVHDGVNDRLVHGKFDPAGGVFVKSDLGRYSLGNRCYCLSKLEFAID